jgi:putative mRNA 3-end processing factor
MLTLTEKGLYCAAGNFYIDPSRGVENAVITHAHSDHARRGSKNYYCVQSGTGLLRARLGKSIHVHSYEYAECFQIGPVQISFHPAGHILGSSQVRLEYAGEVWVSSGDYKREPDSTCEPFESVECDVFVTEATFGTPTYVWPKNRDVGREIFEWWSENSKKGINSILFAYSLGKTQRVLGTLEPYAERPIYCHSAAAEINACYLKEGIRLAKTKCLSTLEPDRILRGDLVIAPQSFLKSEQVDVLGENYQTAFASGWMNDGHHGYDRGFLMSDHADWNDLVRTIEETKAKRVYVQHRGKGALVRHLKTLGLQAFPDTDLKVKNPDQLAFF